MPAEGQAWRKARKRGQSTKIYELRLQRGWTMQEVSDWSGIPIASYARLERGQLANPRLRQLVNLALLFEVSLEDLLQDDWRQWMQLHEEAPVRKPQALPKRKAVD
jgi:transcriptional regulator with XRE-family HTH domain